MDSVIERLNNMENGYLDISHLDLIELPDSPLWKEIKILCCDNNQLTRLPDLPNIEILHCYNNQLTRLLDLPNVRELCCNNNQLTRLPDLPNVEYLHCYNNPLIYNPENRKVFNALFRIISAKKIIKKWLAITHRHRQEKTYQIINQLSEFNILPEEIVLHIINFV